MRAITHNEYEFLVRVENTTGKNLHEMGLSATAMVEEMADGEMGSLLFVVSNNANTKRQLGNVFAEGEFSDLDGVPVKFAVNLDTDGRLYELDLWRVDFGPLQRFPARHDQLTFLADTA